MTNAASTVRALACPNCGGAIALRAAGVTVSLVCEHCGSTLDATGPELGLLLRADAAMRKPAIPLGTRGMLADTAWEVVGYQERSDGEVEWSEYLLHNPYEGYAFLVDDHRRFSLGRLLTVLPTESYGNVRLGTEKFKRFGPGYPVKTIFVVGEFYWRAQVGEEVIEADYVRPGVMLAREDSGPERTWTRLELQDWGIAERAFGLEPRPATMPGGPAPHEPSPHRTAMRDAWKVAGLALAACLVIAIGTAGTARVLQRQLSVPPAGAMKAQVLGPITIDRASERVRITAQAGGLSNQWLDLDYALVDRATQRSYDAGGTAEHYSGSDSEGSWTEGDTAPRIVLAAIPRGSYDLVVEAEAHKWADPTVPTPQPTPDPYDWYRAQGFPVPAPEPVRIEPDPPVPVTITVDRGGGFAGPFWLAALAILVWPLIATFRHLNFEAKRTASTLTTSEDDEEDEE